MNREEVHAFLSELSHHGEYEQEDYSYHVREHALKLLSTFDTSAMYYESHVTVDPLTDFQRVRVKCLADVYNFRLAKLLLRKPTGDEEWRDDAFLTAHSQSLRDIKFRTRQLCAHLMLIDIPVRRYKIEDTVLDSNTQDFFNILPKRAV